MNAQKIYTGLLELTEIVFEKAGWYYSHSHALENPADFAGAIGPYDRLDEAEEAVKCKPNK